MIALRCVGGDPCDVQGSLTMRPVVAEARASTLAIAGGVARLDAPLESEAQLELSASGYWMPSSVVRPADVADGEHAIDVWRTAPLRGRFVVEKNVGEVPAAFQLVVESPAIPAGTTIDCPVGGDGAWSCAIPVAPLDVVLRAKAFTPHYLWSLPPAPRDLGAIPLRRGASLAAWLDRGTRDALKKPATARLIRAVMGDPSPVRDRLLAPVAEGTFNERGMVQLAPVPAGTYTLEVSAPGFATARIEPVEIYGRSESVLRRPIELGPPVAIHLTLSPPLGPDGKPWRIAVTRREEVLSRSVRAASGAASESGAFVLAEQSPGRYRVEVSDAQQNRYADHAFEVGPAPEHHETIRVEHVSVSGTVKLGERPLAATLMFGGRDGAVRIKTIADAEGEFDVTLPRKGQWSVYVQDERERVSMHVDVTVKDGPVDIVLPDTKISGWVVGADGKRLPAARVMLLIPPLGAHGVADAEGTFEFRGVPVGQIAVQARDPRTGEESRSRDVVVPSSGNVDGVELLIEPLASISGIVTSAGQPLVGARVTAMGEVAGSRSLKRAVTGLDGEFRVSLPRAASEVVFLVAAAGRTFQAFRMPVGDGAIRLDLAPAGGSLRLIIPPTAGSPLLVFNDVPVVFNEVLQWAHAHAPAQFKEENHSVVVPHMAPGAYRFCSMLPKSGRVCRDGVLARGSVLQLAIE